MFFQLILVIGTVWYWIAFPQASQPCRSHSEAVCLAPLQTNELHPAWAGPITLQQAFSHPGWLPRPLFPAAVLSSSMSSGSLPYSPFTPRRLPLSRKQSLNSLLSTWNFISSSTILSSSLPLSIGRHPNLLPPNAYPINYVPFLGLSLSFFSLPFHPQAQTCTQVLQENKTKQTHLPLGQLPSVFPFIEPLEQYPKPTVSRLITSYLLLNQPLSPLNTIPPHRLEALMTPACMCYPNLSSTVSCR